MQATTRFTVDATHCQRAADELFDMLWRQDVAFSARWGFDKPLIRGRRIACVAGMLLSLLGFAISLALPIPPQTPWLMRPTAWFVGFFVVFAALFYGLPRLDRAVRPRIERFRIDAARRHAERLVHSARKSAPFEAIYAIGGDLLTYSRERHGVSQPVWQRKLAKYARKGFAFEGASVVALFRSPKSFLPSVVILRDQSEWLPTMLRARGIRVAPSRDVTN